MKNNLVNEDFVNELLKSGVWDIARARPEVVSEATEVTEADASTEEEVTAKDLAKDLFENLSEDVVVEFVNLLHSTLSEGSEEGEEEEPLSPREMAEEILTSVDEDVTLEMIDILYKSLNEDLEDEEDEEDEEGEKGEEEVQEDQPPFDLTSEAAVKASSAKQAKKGT